MLLQTAKLKNLARELGADKVGTAPSERYNQAPPGHRPGEILPGAKSVITFTYRLNDGPLNNLPGSRNQYIMEFDAVNQILLGMSHQLARSLEKDGYESMGIGPEASIGDYARLKGDFSHKHSAVLCGLGTFGVNNLLVTPKHRSRVRLASVITTAPLVYDELLPVSACDQCQQCVHQCPSGALDQWEEHYSHRTGWTINKEKCAHYIFVTNAGKRCGICVKACPQ
ncbi:MAG TPA: epoxyqueuosine reductase [Desulfotomaculum sp.]|nr:MAG: hypothetical protein JL56_11965 [Desulfotomaculum sp. BICA1-6]HBX23229.1 epoxyqueuosine reductase [Desulfotomaculum sp.]